MSNTPNGTRSRRIPLEPSRKSGGGLPPLAEMLVSTFTRETERAEYEDQLDRVGIRRSCRASDGAEGVEWQLLDGSFVRHSECDGWSSCPRED
jgi:hypothetical protein